MNDYYEPIKTKGAFNDNQIELENDGDKFEKIILAGYPRGIRSHCEKTCQWLKEANWHMEN